MYNTSFALKKDLKEAAIIERRRLNEEERKQRIFDARRRIIGVDCQALNEQCKEKQAIEEKKRDTERKFLEEQKRQTVVASIKEQQLHQESLELKKQINEFRLKVQKPEYRRDYDLYDPLAKQKELPARVSDTDPRLTVSSAQIFDGEDLTAQDRKRLQIEQQRAWLEQQIAERKQAEEARKRAESIEYQAMIARENRTLELQRQERKAKSQIHTAVVEYNLALASERKHHIAIEKRKEEEDNLAEQINHITSEMLTESLDAVDSSFGRHRVVPYTYRRMTEEESQKILEERQRQVLELQQKRINVKNAARQWDNLTENFDVLATVKDNEVKLLTNAKLSATAQQNKVLTDEQNRTKEYIDKVVYTNPPTMEYFEQFNTTSR